MRLSANQPIVVGMRADPEPHQPVSHVHRQNAMVSADASGPKTSDLLEVKRGMPWVLLQTRVRLIGEVLDIRR